MPTPTDDLTQGGRTEIRTARPSAQSNPAARSVLDKALALGIRVGVAPDGSEIVLLAPMRVPRETRRWFEIQLDEFRAEVINIILRENGERT